MRTVRLEAPVDQTLRLYLYPFTVEVAGDPAGYPLTETSPRQYEATIPDDTMLGVYRGVVELTSEVITTVIDSGYVTLCQEDGNYLLSNKGPTCSTTPPSQESSETVLPDYGPKRVKTKEMEIEQFDPLRNQIAQERSGLAPPTWCQGAVCVGRGIYE